MKYFLAIFFTVSFVSFALGQHNIYPDTFPNDAGYKSVLVKIDYTCSSPFKKDKLTGKYFLDPAGNTIEYVSIWDNKVNSRRMYSYAENYLVSQQNFSSTRYSPPGSSNLEWDCTLLSEEITFKYAGKKLSAYSVYSPASKKISFDHSFEYDINGRVASETLKNYYDSFAAQLEIVRYAVTQQKKYSYHDTIVTVSYYKNDVLYSTEEITVTKTGALLKQTLKSVKGDILKESSRKYNNKGQVTEIKIKETGYDGFGNMYDMVVPSDKTLFNYDSTGKLISRQIFHGNKPCITERYIYLR